MQVPYTNESGHPVHIGGKRILPGETRMVDETLLVTAVHAPEPDEETGGSVLDLLDGTVAEIEAALPELSDDQLADLLAAEKAGNTRKGAISAITKEQLDRAERDMSATVTAYRETVPNLSDEELAGALADERAGENREAVIEVMTEEQRARAASAGEGTGGEPQP